MSNREDIIARNHIKAIKRMIELNESECGGNCQAILDKLPHLSTEFTNQLGSLLENIYQCGFNNGSNDRGI